MRFVLVAIAGLLASAFGYWGAFAADTSQFVVVIDATAQMAAQFGHQRKIDWVKAAVPAAVKRLGPSASVAVWAFGNDPSRKCQAVSELLSLKPADGATPSMEQALASIQPKAGRAPAFEAISSALKALGEAAQKQTAVVVIAGTGDDCGKDLCASARSLQGLYPNAKLFVFGMAMAQPAVEAYSCAAKAMGGGFTPVKSGADLERNLQQVLTAPKETVPENPGPEKPGKDTKSRSAGKVGEDVALNAMADARGQLTGADAAVKRDKPAALDSTPSKGGEVRTESKSPLPGTGLSTEAAKEKQAAANADASAAKAEPAESMPTDKGPKAEKPAEQPSGASGAARVPPQPEPNAILMAALTAQDPPLNAGVTWRITKMTASPTGQDRAQGAPLWTGGGGPAKVKLPEGHYQVELTYGLALAQGELTVAPSARVEKLFPLGAGMIAAEALQAMNAPKAENVLFALYRNGSGSRREELARSSADPATFYVNAGEYTLSAATGLAKMETPVIVQAGKVSAVKMALNVGVLEIKVFAADGGAKPVAAWHRLYPGIQADSRQPPLLTMEGSSNRVQLPAGSYRLETVYGGVRQETPVTVTAGQVASKTIILNAGEARIHIGADGGNDSAICTIYEAGSDRKTAMPAGRASGTDMTFIVKAGLYDVECRGKAGPAATKEAQVKVVAGEAQVTNIAR